MVVPEFFRTIEQTSLSRWIRDSHSVFGYYFFLLFHTLGLSLLVGASALVDLRILGAFGSAIPLRPLKRLSGIAWFGLSIMVATGVFLLIGYPTKALTNPVFYVKLLFVALALITMRRVSTRVFDPSSLSEAIMIANGKTTAAWSLIFWIGAISAGRLLPETYTYLIYGH